MSNSYFEFKRFRIEQQGCSMKVGTDGVLLGAWFRLEPGMSVLDIGTGTGLVAIMAAQRGAGSVSAVEIDESAAAQAAANAAASEWGAVIQVVNADVSTFRPGLKFDRIVCNPPYFRDSLRCPDAGRNTARHNDSLSFETLMECAALMLAPAGRLSVVIPADAVETLLKCAAVQGLGLSRRTDVVTVAGKTPKRSLVELSQDGGLDAGHEVLCMFGADGKATAEYAALVRDFYLKF